MKLIHEHKLASQEIELDVVEYPRLALTSDRVLKILRGCENGDLKKTSDKEIVCLERLGLIAVMAERYFKHRLPIETAKENLLEFIETGQLEDLSYAKFFACKKLARLDHYPTAKINYTSIGNKRIGLTKIAKALLNFAEKINTKDQHFFELWELFTKDFATPFQRAASPSVIKVLSGLQRDLNIAFKYTKLRSPGGHDLDKLYPELYEARLKLEILFHNLKHFPQSFSYTRKAPEVILRGVEKLVRVLTNTMEEIAPFIIEPVGVKREDHIQTDECANRVKSNVKATGVLVKKHAAKMFGHQAVKAYI